MNTLVGDLTLFIQVCDKPRMFTQSSRYEIVCAYLSGYDAALRGECLSGFGRWLLSESDEFLPLPWWAMIRKKLIPDADPTGPLTDEESEAARLSLKGLLEQYKGQLEKYGLEGAHYKFVLWVRRKRDNATADMRQRFRELG